MDRRRGGWRESHDPKQITPIENELSLHLERAHALAERLKRSNDVVQQEIEQARALACELSDRVASRPERER